MGAPGRFGSTYVRERDQYSKQLGTVKNNFKPPVIAEILLNYNYFNTLRRIYLSPFKRAESRDL